MLAQMSHDQQCTIHPIKSSMTRLTYGGSFLQFSTQQWAWPFPAGVSNHRIIYNFTRY